MPNADPRVALPTGDRQYHIGLGPGELAEYILLPGDPDRTARIATRLDNVEFERRHREFASVTGTYRGTRVSVVSTGIGTDNVEITVAEILAITERPTFVRVGSCGALQPEIGLGDLIVSTGAVRLESTTSYYVHDGYPAVADYEAVLALIEAAERLGHRTHASLARCRAGVVCAVYAQRTTGAFVEGAARDDAEAACVETGLEALLILATMDRQKQDAGTDRWRPSLWN